ncbi:hypothetical protein [Nocardia sp. NPDC050406]|uniref:hypothetical protein n=1 Tax=Nocardia sp. NPDC050406 TaxID=3364318 RepID=UPI0037B47B4D
MASVFNYRYPVALELAPDEWVWWTFGPWDASFEGAAHVEAHPYHGPGSAYGQGLSPTFIQNSVDNFGQHYLHVIFKNTYSTYVTAAWLWLTIFSGMDGGQ